MINENEDIINNIKNIDEEINSEINSENSDKEKIFKLRYRQMIQGLYLNDTMMKNNLYR